MSYNPTSDFVGLWRAISGGVEKAEMPGLDFVVQALGRAGILKLVTSSTAPTINQSTTAWFKPTNPSFSSEGALFLWDATSSSYLPATPALFFALAGSSGSGVPEAPNDGVQYGRQSLLWTPTATGTVHVQPSPPASPTNGMEWWDGTTFRVYDGTQWKVVGPVAQTVTISGTTPTAPFAGMLWWNAVQLQLYDGLVWKLVGPPLGPTSLPIETTTLTFSITQTTSLTVPTTSWGAVPLVDTPIVDTLAGWNATTHKYTPTKAGYYAFGVRGGPHTAGGLAILKNDSGTPNALTSDTIVAMTSNVSSTWQAASGFAQMNGTTDFVRYFALSQTSGTMDPIGSSPCFTALRLP